MTTSLSVPVARLPFSPYGPTSGHCHHVTFVV